MRLKQMDAEASQTSPQKPGTPASTGNKSGKGQAIPMSEQPCKFFRSDTGCKAGRSCKWSRSWDGVEDKNSRCWICGGKDHRKSNCKIKGNGNKPPSNESGLGGGRGGNQNAANKAVVKQASVGKGHDGSATSSTTDATTSQPSADGPGLGAEGNGALSSATSEVEKGGSSSCQSCDHGTIGGSHSVAEVSAYAQLEGDAAVKH